MLSVERSIYRTPAGNYSVYVTINGKLTYFGTFVDIADARRVREVVFKKFPRRNYARGRRLTVDQWIERIESMDDQA